MAAVECLNQEQAQSYLGDLKIGLLTLHHYLLIGNQYYNFKTYKPEPEVVQDYGAEGANEDEIADEKADDTSQALANEDSFDIEDTIDIDNLDLCNALSNKPIIILKPITQQKQAVPPIISASKELGESDWVFG